MLLPAVAAVAAYLGFSHLLARFWPSSKSKRGPEDVPSLNPKNAAEHRAARSILLQAFQEEGESPTLQELQYVQGVGWQETSYGKGWGPVAARLQNPELLTLNNWASEQCSPLGDDCIGGEDHLPDGSAFTVGFRKSSTPVDGARQLVKEVIKQRRGVQSALKDPEVTVMRASYLMRRGTFYGGYCPAATKTYGAAAARASLKEPDRDEGTRACAREAIETHARLIWSAIRDIAGATGDATIIPLGTYDAADEWYSRRLR